MDCRMLLDDDGIGVRDNDDDVDGLSRFDDDDELIVSWSGMEINLALI